MSISINDTNEYYTYFYSKIYQSEKYILKYTDSSESTAEKFVKLFNDKYPNGDIIWLWNYCVFQFSYWDGITISNQFSNGRVTFQMIFGKKAFIKFIERDQSFDWTFDNHKFLDKYELHRYDVRRKIFASVNEEFDVEELAKKSCVNQPDTLANCIDLTTLFKPESQFCMSCDFSKECKIILKKNHPDLYKLRKI